MMRPASSVLPWLMLLALQIPGLLPAQDAPPPEGVRPAATLRGLPDWVMSVAFSSDDRLAGGTYELVRLWQVTREEDDLQLRPLGDLPINGYARSLAFSPDGATLAVGSYQQVQLFDRDRQVTGELRGHRGYVTGLAFTPDGIRLVTCSEDRTIRIWNVADLSEMQVLSGHAAGVWGVAISPDGNRIASAAGDETRLTRAGEVFLWSGEDGSLLQRLAPPQRCATHVAFSADGLLLLSTGYDERVNVYDAQSGRPHGYFGQHSRPTNAVVVIGEGRLAISGSGGRFAGKNEIKFFNPADGEEYGTLDVHQGKVNALALSADGRLLASASHDRTIIVWDIAGLLQVLQIAELPVTGVERPADAPAEIPPEAATPDECTAQPVGAPESPQAAESVFRVGIIGLDTSHSIAFTQALHAESPPESLAGCRVVAAYPYGSRDIASSADRIPGYTEQIRTLGVEVVDSIEELLEQVDGVLLETNDGRPHLEQALLVFEAGKPVFIDKPAAGSIADVVAIYRAADHYGVPVFSSSSLRWIEQALELRGGSYGAVFGCETYSPCHLEPTHPDLYWYGIHGVEALYAVMGTGCETVTRINTPGAELAVGVWEGGRIGSFRGIRQGRGGYGGTVFCENGIVSLGAYRGYGPLVEQIVHLFRTGEPPVSAEETIELYAFMEAADESKRQGGVPVRIADVLQQAESAAASRLHELRPEVFP